MRRDWKRLAYVVFLGIIGIIWVPWACLAQNNEQSVETAPDKVAFEDVRREMRELEKVLGEYGVDQRDKAVERLEPVLEALDQRLRELEDAIENNWDEMSEAAREHSRQVIRELQRQRIILAEKFGALKSASESAWEQLREGFLDAFAVLNEAWEKSLQEFRRDHEAREGLTL